MDKALPPIPRPRRLCECQGSALGPLTARLRRDNEQLREENERLARRIQELERLQDQVRYRNTIIDVQNDALRNILNFVHVTASDCMAKLGKRQQVEPPTSPAPQNREKPSDNPLWL
jgi:vacuolar-type H+-ATPase subunit I/STV1